MSVLPFQSRAERREAEVDTAVDAASRYTAYEKETLRVCRDLVTFYQQSKQWTPECDTAMIRVVRELQQICRKIAPDVTHEPQTQDPR